MTIAWTLLPFALAMYVLVVAVRARRAREPIWQLAAGIAIIATHLGTNRLVGTDTQFFYVCLVIELLLLCVACYWIWRFDRGHR